MSENGRGFNAEGSESVAGAEKDWIAALDTERPVLIAGPTASGKSAVSLDIAERLGGPIINADALQVFSDWRVLTARPSAEDEARHPHALYGHISGDTAYSVGHWLRDIRPFLDGPPPVIVGGTGLYFTALTEGLADIPETPPEVRATALARLENDGPEALLAEIDPETANRIDAQNPMRIQRAWEVLTATGRGLAEWQDNTGPALIPLSTAQCIVLHAPKDWLNPRIDLRFRQMIDQGALNEAKKNAPDWRADLPSAKAIGARELIAHVRGDLSMEDAVERAIIQTRQYAKRQRSWFRARMRDWTWIDAPGL